jgi:hypothetical protein
VPESKGPERRAVVLVCGPLEAPQAERGIVTPVLS